jgi:hypothetical protein
MISKKTNGPAQAGPVNPTAESCPGSDPFEVYRINLLCQSKNCHYLQKNANIDKIGEI